MHLAALKSKFRAHSGQGRLSWLQKILFRRIWLPRGIYAALPWFYLCVGLCALGAALFLSHWAWIIPYLLLVGCISLHAASAVFNFRGRARRRTYTRSKKNLRQ
jgi:hypothetical protein